MADERLNIRVTADASAAEAEIRDLDRLADQVDLDPKVDTSGIDSATSGMDSLVESAGMLPGPLGDAAGLLGGAGGIAAGGLAAAGALFAAADATADAAMEAASLQAAVGGTTEETSRLLAATKSVGLDYNDLLELIAESNRAIGQNADEAKRLGVNIGGTPIERFQQLVDAVYQIPDPLERSAAASKFFGEEGSKQLPKLIGMYGDLSTALESVPESAIMSEEDVKNAQEFKKTMAELKAEIGALANELGKLAIPALTSAIGGVNWAFEQLGNGVSSVKTGLGNLFTGDWDEFVNGEKKVADMADTADRLGDALSTGLADGLGIVTGAVGDATAVLEEQRSAAEDLQTAWENLRGEVLGMADAQIAAQRGAQDLNDAIVEAGKEGGVTRDEYEDLNDQIIKNAEYQVTAAGATRDSMQGSALYDKALRTQALTMGNTLNPEIVDYLGLVGAIPPEAVTDIKGMLERGEFDQANAAIAAIDAATPTATVGVTKNQQEFADANAALDALDRREVVVDISARVTDAARNVVNNLLGGLGGGRSQQSTAARYVWRNGRYVEV